ncbi:MAG: hypothetical protein V3U54_08920 [Thermodesulfobacteriota bacterium]
MDKVIKNELISKINSIIETTKTATKTMNTLNTKNSRTVLNIVETVITLIEQHSANVEKLDGKAKKKLAVEILNKYINIKIKFIPRKIMEKIEGIIIGFAIEFAVGWLNKRLGKAWLQG